MIRRPAALLLALVLSLAVSRTAAAQPPATWRLETARAEVETARESTTHGYAALPASVLVALGAEMAYEDNAVAARFGGVEARFAAGSADVRIAGTTRTLANPAYLENGIVYIPAEFFGAALNEWARGALVADASQHTVRRGAIPPEAAVAPAIPSADPPAAARSQPLAVQTASARPVRRLVVVDAGHGGVDPGAHGPGGTREKDVTLRVARMVADLLREDPTLEVRMTRDRDTLIALHDRARFANRWRDEGQPAVFISIHCNANESRAEKGFETYFLSEARTADAQRVANFENASVQYEEHAASGDALGFILTDLRQNHYLRESSDWAQRIQSGLRAIHPGPDRGVKQAGFAVLRGTFMPAVLVEIGFISNSREEQLLNDRDMEATIARQLADAVRAYFERPGVRPASE
jgi:N-acetylmuramoyl-L-alanine amidase